MPLSLYKKKRNFSVSPEPKAVIKKSTPSLSFVVQRHKASHLHYDFRLEMDGVLKSWAVPKGPSMNPMDKRLAMMVEDHPYSYKDFKGVIPSGYGAGIVEIWDSGKYTDINNSAKTIAEKNLKASLKAGNLKFTLHGKKLKGEFALVKLKTKEDNSWLLIKHNDEFAVHKEYNSEEETLTDSPINKWLTENKQPQKKKFYKALKLPVKKLNSFIKPMLAKETDKPFDDEEWLYEIKWDGYRAIAEINKNNIELYSRNGNSFNLHYPVVVNELKKINQKAVLDGEVVILDEKGKSDFQKLQDYENNNSAVLCYYVFDLLSLNGRNLYELPLIDRKKLLRKIIPKNSIVKYSDHILENGVDFFTEAKKQNLEGIMAKKISSRYHPGFRTNEWLKIKHHKSEDVIVVGYTKPTGSRKYFGALVLALDTDKGLKYIGHTGSGFNEKMLKELYEQFSSFITNKSPFAETVKTNAPVTWVKPKFICEVKFTEWTSDGKMRHPIFLRMRADKSINDMIKKTKTRTASEEVIEKEISFKKNIIKITNPNKVFWPQEGITKSMLVDYYQSMAEYILPYLKDRPESLKRNPNGIADKGFFHKDAGESAPDWVKSFKIYSESANKEIDYIICNDKITLAYLNNLGCIEINPWNSTIKSLDKPDYMIIDIDPAEKNTFEQVIKVANAFKKILDKAGADAYCKTSGATGLHIYVPMEKKYSYEQVKGFAEFLCTMVNDELPLFTSVTRNLAKRGNDKIYLDYLQNRRGQTIAAAYSIRPFKGATVSTPLQWKEVKYGLDPANFNINNVLKRVEKLGDLFINVFGKGINMQECLKKLS